MKCPHCTYDIHVHWREHQLSRNSHTDTFWYVRDAECSRCSKAIVEIDNGSQRTEWERVCPRTGNRPVPEEVPSKYGDDFTEANEVLPISAKASAAISRRCLQLLIRDELGITKRNLEEEIDEAAPKVPSYLADQLHGVRTVGNFAAHSTKSTNTGEIVEVEPGEAEWLLDTLEGMFDFLFVAPAKAKEMKSKVNAKLKEAGKPEMK